LHTRFSRDWSSDVCSSDLIGIISVESDTNYFMVGLNLVMQLVIGGVAGYGLGKLAVFTINRLKIDNRSLYPILVFTFCIFIFSITYYIKGNGYLAVYIGGLVIGNSTFIHKRLSLNFFDCVAWMS